MPLPADDESDRDADLLAAKRRTPHKIDKFLLVLPAFRRVRQSVVFKGVQTNIRRRARPRQNNSTSTFLRPRLPKYIADRSHFMVRCGPKRIMRYS
jgi:hypothetical protein